MFVKLKYIMKVFVRLNVFSALYAFVLFIQLLPILNIYAIVRITHCPYGTVYTLMAIFNLIILTTSTIMFFTITRKYLSTGNLRFLLTLLWVPYYAILTIFFYSLSPIVRGEEPPPVLGLLLIGIFLIYPFFIAFINVASSKK